MRAYDLIAAENPKFAREVERYLATASGADERGRSVNIYDKSLEQFMATTGHHMGDVGTLANHVRILVLKWINLQMDPDRQYPLLGLFPIVQLDRDTLTLRVNVSAITKPEFTPATEGTLPRIGGVQYSEFETYARRQHVGLQSDLTALMTSLGAEEVLKHSELIVDAAARLLEQRIYGELHDKGQVVWSLVNNSSNPSANYKQRTRFFAMAQKGFNCITNGLSRAIECAKVACPATTFDTVICRAGLLKDMEFEREVLERNFRDKAGGVERQIKRLIQFDLEVINHNGIMDNMRRDITLNERSIMEFYVMEPEQGVSPDISICNFSNDGTFTRIQYETACRKSECFNDIDIPNSCPANAGDIFGEQDAITFERKFSLEVYKNTDKHVWFASARRDSTNAVIWGDWVVLDQSVTRALIRALISEVRKSVEGLFDESDDEHRDVLRGVISNRLFDNNEECDWFDAVMDKLSPHILQNATDYEYVDTPGGSIMKYYSRGSRLSKRIASIVVSLPICTTVLCSLAYNNLPSPFSIMLIRPNIEFTTDNIILVQKKGGKTAELGINYPITVYGDDPQVNQRIAIVSFYEALAVIDKTKIGIIPDVSINEYIGGGGTEFIRYHQSVGWTGDLMSIVVPPGNGPDRWCNVPCISDRSPNLMHQWISSHIAFKMKELQDNLDLGDESGYRFSVDRGVYLKSDGTRVNSSGLLGYIGGEAEGGYKRAQMTAMPKGTVGYQDFNV